MGGGDTQSKCITIALTQNITERTNKKIVRTIDRKTKQLEKCDKEIMSLKEKNFINKNKAMYYLEFLQNINKDINIIDEKGNILNNEILKLKITQYFEHESLDNLEYVIV